MKIFKILIPNEIIVRVNPTNGNVINDNEALYLDGWFIENGKENFFFDTTLFSNTLIWIDCYNKRKNQRINFAITI